VTIQVKYLLLYAPLDKEPVTIQVKYFWFIIMPPCLWFMPPCYHSGEIFVVVLLQCAQPEKFGLMIAMFQQADLAPVAGSGQRYSQPALRVVLPAQRGGRLNSCRGGFPVDNPTGKDETEKGR
jgi:hypothetical protein